MTDGNDTLFSRAENDRLYDAGGADTLYGGTGEDTLRGRGGPISCTVGPVTTLSTLRDRIP